MTLRERMARAIRDKFFTTTTVVLLAWDECIPEMQEQWLVLADACLRAMREHCESAPPAIVRQQPSGTPEYWQAMIDAALSETNTEGR